MSADLLPTASTKETWRALRPLLRAHRMLALATLVCLTSGTAAGLLVPPILGHIVDLVVDHHDTSAILAPVVWMVGAGIAQTLLTGVGRYLVARLGETLLATLRERVLRRALAMPLGRLERAGTGDLIARVSGDVSVIANASRQALPALAEAGLTVGLTVVGLATIDWRFALAGLLAGPVQWHTLRWYLRRSAPIFARERIAEGARTQQLLDSIGGMQTVRAHRLTDDHVDRVAARSQDSVDLGLATNRLQTRFFGRLNLAEFVGLAAVLLMGFWLVRADAVSVGAAAAAALYFHRIFDPINVLLGLFGTAQEALAGLARLVGVPETEPADQPEPADGSIAVTDVDFEYAEGHRVLREVGLDVADGECVAVVGPSGAGKTTLAKLIAGVHPPTAGTVRVGGARTHAGTALVTQEVHVFACSVEDNLRMARPAATDDQIRSALERSGASGWVAQLPDGLATVVGVGGVSLTPQRAQQLALARLALIDPPVAILDEATAEAGSSGARALDAATRRVLAGRTSIVVAHRLSQAMTADRVVVVEDGRIVENGDPRELADGDGPFAALWRAWSTAR